MPFTAPAFKKSFASKNNTVLAVFCKNSETKTGVSQLRWIVKENGQWLTNDEYGVVEFTHQERSLQ